MISKVVGRVLRKTLERPERYHLPPEIFIAQQRAKGILEQAGFQDVVLKVAEFSKGPLGNNKVYGFELHAEVPSSMQDKVQEIVTRVSTEMKVPIGYELKNTIRLIWNNKNYCKVRY